MGHGGNLRQGPRFPCHGDEDVALEPVRDLSFGCGKASGKISQWGEAAAVSGYPSYQYWQSYGGWNWQDPSGGAVCPHAA